MTVFPSVSESSANAAHANESANITAAREFGFMLGIRSQRRKAMHGCKRCDISREASSKKAVILSGAKNRRLWFGQPRVKENRRLVLATGARRFSVARLTIDNKTRVRCKTKACDSSLRSE